MREFHRLLAPDGHLVVAFVSPRPGPPPARSTPVGCSASAGTGRTGPGCAELAEEDWGAYGSSKAALETLLGSYADETAHTGRIRVHIVDPGATRTRMRALAFPGEEPERVKPPQVVAAALDDRARRSATGEKIRVET